MQALANFAKGPTDNSSMLEQLMHRVRETPSLPEKRNALNDMKNLLHDQQEASQKLGRVGGISFLVDILAQREDLELVQGALEILSNSIQDIKALEANRDLFLQSNDNLAVLLSLLDPQPIGIKDFYVYYHAVQCLNSCLKTGMSTIQQVIGSREDGMNGLLGLLSEREAVRNEVLLILKQLTEENTKLQNLTGKPDTFTTLFEIIKTEGGSEGGIVVHDCLDLVDTLLKANENTQRIFRFMELVDVKTLGAEALLKANQSVSSTKIENLKTALRLTLLLVGETNIESARLQNCVELNRLDCLLPLSQLCLNEGGVKDGDVRKMAHRCIGNVLLLVPESKNLLAKLLVFLSAQPTQALLVLLKIGLTASDPDESSAAISVLESFFNSNPAKQEEFFAQFSQKARYSFTDDLVNALESCREGSDTGGRAALVMASIVRKNLKIQNACRTTKVSLPHGQDPTPFIHWVMDLLSTSVQFGSNSRVTQNLVLCVISSLHGCPAVVEELLQVEIYSTLLLKNLQKAIEDTINYPDAAINDQSLFGVFFTACLATAIQTQDYPNSPAMVDYLKNVVSSSVGVDNYLFFLSSIYDKTGRRPNDKLHLILKELIVPVQSSFPAAYPPAESTSNHPHSTDNLDEEKERLQTELESVKEELERLRQAYSTQIGNSDRLIEQERTLQDLKSQIAAVQSEKEELIKTRNDLFICLGMENSKTKLLAEKLLQLGYDPTQILSDAQS